MKKPDFIPYLNDSKNLILPYTTPVYYQRFIEWLSTDKFTVVEPTLQLDYVEIRIFNTSYTLGLDYKTMMLEFIKTPQDHETA